jgi:hypothetical protein
MLALATKLDTDAAADSQGTISARPAAGKRGRYYWATDTKTLWRDDGTVWRRMYSEWISYTPAVFQVAAPGNGPIPYVVSGDVYGRYMYVGNSVCVQATLLVALQASSPSGPYYGITLPVAPANDKWVGAAVVQNGVGHALTMTAGQSGTPSPGGVQVLNYAHTGLVRDDFGRYDRFNITYEI